MSSGSFFLSHLAEGGNSRSHLAQCSWGRDHSRQSHKRERAWAPDTFADWSCSASLDEKKVYIYFSHVVGIWLWQLSRCYV